MLGYFSHPGHNSGVMHSFHLGNRSEPRAVDVHPQALTLELIAVASVGVVARDELAPAVVAKVLLLALPIEAVFDDSTATTFWAGCGGWVGGHVGRFSIHGFPFTLAQCTNAVL